MLFDPVTFLMVRSRAKKQNLSNSDALKASILGSVIGGGNATTGLLFADHSIKKKARSLAVSDSVPNGPENCMDKLIQSLGELVDCKGAEKVDEKELIEVKKSFTAILRKLSLKADQKKMIEQKIDAVAASQAKA